MRRQHHRKTSRRIADLRGKRVNNLVSGRRYNIVLNRGVRGSVRFLLNGAPQDIPARVALHSEGGGLEEQSLQEGCFNFPRARTPETLQIRLLGAAELPAGADAPVSGRLRFRLGGELHALPARLALRSAGHPAEEVSCDAEGGFRFPARRGVYSLRVQLARGGSG